MSQDLLAEFGSFSVNDDQKSGLNQAQKTTSHPEPLSEIHHAQPSIPYTAEDAWAEDDEDDFGDFEEPTDGVVDDGLAAASPPKAKIQRQTIVKTTKATPPASKREPVKTIKTEAPVRATASPEKNLSKGHPFGHMSDVLFDAEAPTVEKKLSKGHPFADMSDVLFDAEYSDEEGMFEVVPVKETNQKRVHNDEDDFGDFESTALPAYERRQQVEPAQLTASQPATFDLLGFDDEKQQESQSSQIAARIASNAQSSKSKTPVKTAPAKVKSKPHHRSPPQVDQEDFAEWDDFETPPAQPTQSTTKLPPIDVSTTNLGDLLAPAPTTPPQAPSNIPPPSLLLTLFPPLLNSTSTTLLTPLATLPTPQKSPLLTSHTLHAYLRTYLALTHILAHILAGRKLRWKRDRFLAQSMRIGPSVSGRSGGMKLAGVDGNESRREEAECEDVLRVWREQVGRLKSAVVGASSASSASGRSGGGAGGVNREGSLPAVPDLAVTMPVRVAKQDEGGVVGLVACALCGLKREERVVKVDVDVEDSFGEWWMEGTNMHLACWNFWSAHRDSLRGR